MRKLALVLLAVACGKQEAAPAGSGSAAATPTPAPTTPTPAPAPPPAGSGSSSAVVHTTLPLSVRCSSAVYRGMSLQQHDLKRDNPTLTDAMIARMIAIAAAHCEKDGWTDLALNCYADAKVTKDVAACDLLLTKEQRRKLDTDVQKVGAPSEIAEDHGCEAALATGTRALEAGLQKNWNAKFEKWMADGIAGVYLARCRRDRWSPVLLACLSTVKSDGDLARCPDLDATQQQRLDAALMPYYKNAMEEKAAARSP